MMSPFLIDEFLKRRFHSVLIKTQIPGRSDGRTPCQQFSPDASDVESRTARYTQVTGQSDDNQKL
ncbi:hypothetical protein DN597_00135 [Enterobacter cloacae]|nr:hypothetical protein DN597_00135 [Enterobacter cloacae]